MLLLYERYFDERESMKWHNQNYIPQAPAEEEMRREKKWRKRLGKNYYCYDIFIYLHIRAKRVSKTEYVIITFMSACAWSVYMWSAKKETSKRINGKKSSDNRKEQ